MLALKRSVDAAAEAEDEAREAVLCLLAVCERNHGPARIADAADAAYLAVGRLAVLARAASQQ